MPYLKDEDLLGSRPVEGCIYLGWDTGERFGVAKIQFESPITPNLSTCNHSNKVWIEEMGGQAQGSSPQMVGDMDTVSEENHLRFDPLQVFRDLQEEKLKRGCG